MALPIVDCPSLRRASITQKLPDNILATIFIACLPQAHDTMINANQSPLLLGRICSRWRSIALRTPGLWSSLSIPVPKFTPSTFFLTPEVATLERLVHRTNIRANFHSKVRRHCAFIKEWLRRAGSLPLSISISFSDMHTKSYGELRPYLDIVISFADKARRLHLTLPDGTVPERLSHLKPSDTPELEELVLIHTTCDLSEEQAIDWTKWKILESKTLQSLSLHYFPEAKVAALPLNWSCLTRLEPGLLTVVEAYMILDHCPELIYLSFEVNDSDVSEDNRDLFGSFLPLPHLESLTITDHSETLHHLFDCLEVPALKTVEFYSTLKPSDSHPSALLTLLRRCPWGFTRLTIDAHSFTYADLMQCLIYTPFLVDLSIRRRPDVRISRQQEYASKNLPVSVVDSLLRALTPSNKIDDDFRCPLLTRLSIENGLNVSDRAVLSFIRGRRGRDAPMYVAKLWSVEATLTHSREEDVYPGLTEYINDGMRVVLRYSRAPPRNASWSTSPRRRVIP